jgi:hypothetical protein
MPAIWFRAAVVLGLNAVAASSESLVELEASINGFRAEIE